MEIRIILEMSLNRTFHSLPKPSEYPTRLTSYCLKDPLVTSGDSMKNTISSMKKEVNRSNMKVYKSIVIIVI
jgi:hypothetical protein